MYETDFPEYGQVATIVEPSWAGLQKALSCSSAAERK